MKSVGSLDFSRKRNESAKLPDQLATNETRGILREGEGAVGGIS